MLVQLHSPVPCVCRLSRVHWRVMTASCLVRARRILDTAPPPSRTPASYVDILDAESGHQRETALLAFDILTMYISGHNAVRYSQQVLLRGAGIVQKVFRALSVALPHLPRLATSGPESLLRTDVVDVEHMGAVLYPPGYIHQAKQELEDEIPVGALVGA
jgi:hypothetical protein